MNPAPRLSAFAPALLFLMLFAAFASGAAETAPRPNLLFILVDDLRWDELGCTGHAVAKTPNIDRIAREGGRFLNAFATTPICSPSRASILTGLYTHRHGIIDNTERGPLSHQLKTFPQALQRAGYETAFIGKWHMGNDDTARPGFDHWVCLQGQGTSNDPQLNVDGRRVEAQGYTTDVLSERALAFLKRKRSKPFMLFLAHKALHPELTQYADGRPSDPTASKFIPAERHKDLYSDATMPRRANAFVPPQNKPALEREIGNLPPLGRDTGTSDEVIRDRLRMLAAVDESTGALLDQLKKSGQLDRTLVVFTSDHGYWYGEHGLSVERRLAYEEGIRIPLLMRYPGWIKAGDTRAQLVLTIDFAPTFVELAGAKIPASIQGRSLLPVIKGESKDWRKSLLIEYYSDTVFPRIQQMGYKAVRTERFKFIDYLELEDMDELYDLQADPFELNNLIEEPSAVGTLTEMKSELYRLLSEGR